MVRSRAEQLQPFIRQMAEIADRMEVSELQLHKERPGVLVRETHNNPAVGAQIRFRLTCLSCWC